MPLFEYRCAQCGHRFEELTFGSEQKAPACPKCGGRKTERQLSTFSAASGSGGSCDFGGGCSTGSCPTGSCPFS